jgi:hypothetical protein
VAVVEPAAFVAVSV